MIELTDVSLMLGQRQLFDSFNLKIDAPLTAVMGPSGSGKTTLLRMVVGLLDPAAGCVTLDGDDVQRQTWSQPPDPRLALIQQDYGLVEFLSARDNVLFAAEMRGLQVEPGKVDQTLDRVGLDPVTAGRRPTELSGGEQQRVAICRALVCDVAVLVADEPTGALDQANTQVIAKILRQVADTTQTQVLVATHDPSVASVADKVINLADNFTESQVAG